MSLRFRDAVFDDLDLVLESNQAAGVSIAAIDRSTLARCFESATYFRIAEVNGEYAGFLIGVDHHAEHDSPGFRWFRERHSAFVFIDRIVIAPRFRGHGLGRVFYADLTSFSEVRVPVLGCQVSLEPRDDASLLFHATLGFHETAQLVDGNGHRLGVMERVLCSYPFVRQRYLEQARGKLPDLPWLSTRALPVTPAPEAMRRAGAA
jgi:hypothetical protein